MLKKHIHTRYAHTVFAILCAIVFFIPTFFLSSHSIFAQNNRAQDEYDQPVLVQDEIVHYKARVEKILSDTNEVLPGFDANTRVQKIIVTLLSNDRDDTATDNEVGDVRLGTQVEIQNDYTPVEVGEKIYVTRTSSQYDGADYWRVTEPYRLPWLVGFTVLFVLAVVVFGGVQGIRGLVTLVGSLALIVYVLFPGVLAGYSPVAVSVFVAGVIIVFGSYLTHGVSKMTTSAVIGMLGTVVFTGLLTWFGVVVTKLSGFESEEALYLNFNTGGSIDFQGLLLGGILIGLLGALYDVAIGQAISVEELYRMGGPNTTRRAVYTRAIRMGREHIGALVNTLAIAYAGASLPLLLLFYSSSSGSLAFTINREIFAAEIIRTMIGGIGLVFAVPITTLVAVFLLTHMRNSGTQGSGGGHAGHSHGHGHHHGHTH